MPHRLDPVEQPVTGKSNIQGGDLNVPSMRQVAVARAYVQGLEEDREKLQDIRGHLITSTWEVIRLVAFNNAVVLALRRTMDENSPPDEDFEARRAMLLEEAAFLREEVVICPCGHSKYDHDDKGCMYLQCRGICA